MAISPIRYAGNSRCSDILSLEVAETVRGRTMLIDPAVDDVAMET
jgi:hypothetical protein